MLKYIFITLSLYLLNISCLFRPGPCPRIKLENDTFLENNYMGKWYEVARTKNDTVRTGSCVEENYTLTPDGTINTTITEYTNNGLSKIKGRMSPTRNPFVFNGSWVSSNGSLHGHHIVVYSTDYNSFAVEYSCTNVLGGRNEYVFIKFRRKNYDEDTLEELMDNIEEKMDISKDLLDMTRKNC